MDTLLHDLRYATRSLLRSPGFALVAILTLALGIGANTTIFTVVRSVILRPLPYAEPDRIVMLWNSWTDEPKIWLSEPEVLDYQGVSSLEDVAAYAVGEANLTGERDPERVPGAFMTANMLDVLGMQPMLGRGFTPDEAVSEGSQVVVLSHGLWQRRFGGDPGVVGQTIRINGEPNVVLGVMPPDFKLPLDFREARPAQLFVPLELSADDAGRGSRYLLAVSRLQPGATLSRARAELNAVVQSWKDKGLIDWAPEFAAVPVPVAEEVTGDVRPALLVLLAAVALVLLIACVNVANLLLARSDGRRREMAVRAAIGAGHGRILRQLLTESFLLALVGGAVGLAGAGVAVQTLVAIAPEGVPRVESLGLDAMVLGFSAAVVLLTGMIFGVVPALEAARPDLAGGLREGGRAATAGGTRQRFRRALVVAEIALSVLLVIGAGLLIRSFAELRNLPLGFQPDGVLTAQLALPSSDYPEESDVVAFYRELTERVQVIPGVERAAAVRLLPLAGEIGDWGIDIEGKAEPSDNTFNADLQIATPGYFEGMGIQLRRGRGIEETDRADALPIVVINRTMAERYFPGEDPIGQRLRLGGDEQGRPWMTVVGTVEDVRHNAVSEEARREMYLPHAQTPTSLGGAPRTLSLVIRTTGTGSPASIAARLREEVARMDPNLPLADVRPLEDIVSAALVQPRFTMVLLAAFAALALVLAAIGIYGVLSYAVAQRTQEIGIRMALGAERGRVLRMVLRQGMTVALLGVGVGLLGAWALARVLASQLYGISPSDPLTFAVVALILVAVALLASFIPARRATRVDPMVALRAD